MKQFAVNGTIIAIKDEVKKNANHLKTVDKFSLYLVVFYIIAASLTLLPYIKA